MHVTKTHALARHHIKLKPSGLLVARSAFIAQHMLWHSVCLSVCHAGVYVEAVNKLSTLEWNSSFPTRNHIDKEQISLGTSDDSSAK